jgi:PAS domain S-box-containing protein
MPPTERPEVAEQLTGNHEVAIVGRHIGCLYPPEHVAQGLPDDMLRREATHGTVITDGTLLRHDGTCVTVRDGVPSLSDPGVLRGYAKVKRDISERKQLEAKLRQHERRERALLAVLPDPLFCVGRDGTVEGRLAAGDASVEHGGVPAAGSHLRDLVPDAADQLLAAIPAALDAAGMPDGPRLLAPVREDNGSHEWRMIAWDDQHVLLLRRDVTSWRPVSAVMPRD